MRERTEPALRPARPDIVGTRGGRSIGHPAEGRCRTAGAAVTGRPEPAGAWSLLRSNPGLCRLGTARAVSAAGDALSLVALMLHVAGTTGQAVAVAALLLVGDVAPALLGPLTGTVGDRFDRRRVLVVCELVQGGVLLAIALVGARAVAGQIAAPTARAVVPVLVPGRHLPTANSQLGFGTHGAEAIGPLPAAVLVGSVGCAGCSSSTPRRTWCRPCC